MDKWFHCEQSFIGCSLLLLRWHSGCAAAAAAADDDDDDDDDFKMYKYMFSR